MKIFVYYLKTSKEKRSSQINTNFLNHKTLAVICDYYPITYPRDYPSPRNFIAKLFTFNLFFRERSYSKIIGAKNVIYFKTDELGYFRDKILPNIGRDFVLVTGDSDVAPSEYKDIIKNRFLVKWFAQNLDFEGKNVLPLPIGINYSSLIFNDSFGEKRKSAKMQEKELIKIKSKKIKQEMKVFANFHLSFTSGRRREIYEKLRENPIMYWQKKKMPRSKMWELQKRFAFNFSPVGNGLDCHRTWESLILGQIPIVERTGKEIDKLYEEFPIVLIDDLSEINEENLKKWYKKYSKKFTPEMERKLTNDYWIEKIRSVSD